MSIENITEQEVLKNATGWYQTNKKIVNGVLLGIVIAVAGYFGYKKFVLEPKQEKAAQSIYMAEQMFEQQNWKLALEGQPGTFEGFNKIISNYGGTQEANLAHFYAGVCELNLGNASKAIKHLEDFDGHGSSLQARAYGLLGDAYADMNNNEKAISFYTKASTDLENDITNAPMYMFRKGLLLEKQGKIEDAKAEYLKIKKHYPSSFVASDIDKYLARVGVVTSY